MQPHIFGPSGTTTGAGNAGRYFILRGHRSRRAPSGREFHAQPETFRGIANIAVCAGVGFLAGLVLAAPLAGAASGALLGSLGTATATHAGISEDFICDAEAIMKPGTSALFLLDDEGDMEMILQKLRSRVGRCSRSTLTRNGQS